MKEIVIYTDGGARGNPGPAGAGAVIYRDGEEVAYVSEFLGRQTNNWAEYEALRLALVAAAPFAKGHTVCVFMDSELIVQQMNGKYRVKDAELKKQYARVRELIEVSYPDISFEHVRREANARADELANNAMDRSA
ncbi:MAG: ribonuclease HI family protein [Candidatus Paceibacteria bacterium]